MALFRSDSRDVDFVPGTVRLFEFDHHDGTLAVPELVLVPTPSAHPDDPLNWSAARKHLSLACVCLYTLALGLETSALYSIYVPYSEATGISIATLNSAVGVMYLCVGFAPILTNPLAAVIGKRPVYLGSMLLAIGIAVWSPFIRSTPEWYGRCALLGVAGGPIFGTTEPSIADVYFQHERAAPMSVYVVVLYMGALLCPLLGAYIAEGIDYQAVFYFNAIVIAVVFVFCFFFMEETNYHRDTDSIVTEARNEATPTHEDDDMPKPGAIQLQKVPASSHVVQADVRRKSFVQRLALWTRPRGSVLHNLRDGVLQPLQFLRLPIVWFCAIQYAFGQVYFNMINAITAQILYAPPYLFTTTQIGLTYLSPIIMTIPSVLAFGWYSDRFAVKMARRNGGISEPEHKLWLMMPLFIALPLSILFLGFAPYYGLHWAAYVIGGMGLSCAAGGVLTTAALNYLFDSYHDFKSDKATSASEDSPQMLAVLPPAMAIPFGFGYAITPWIGNLKTFAISAACVAFAVNALALPMMRWGKSLRRRDAGILYGKGQ